MQIPNACFKKNRCFQLSGHSHAMLDVHAKSPSGFYVLTENAGKVTEEKVSQKSVTSGSFISFGRVHVLKYFYAPYVAFVHRFHELFIIPCNLYIIRTIFIPFFPSFFFFFSSSCFVLLYEKQKFIYFYAIKIFKYPAFKISDSPRLKSRNEVQRKQKFYFT